MLFESYLEHWNNKNSLQYTGKGDLLRYCVSLLIFYSHYDPLLHLTQDSYKDSVSKLAVVTVRLLVVLSGVDMNHPAIQNITYMFTKYLHT